MPTKSEGQKFDLDAAFVRKLAKLLEETGLGEIEYAEGERKIRVAVPRVAAMHVAPSVPLTVASAVGAGSAPPEINGTPVTAPMVGTVYLAASPESPPFVKVGDKVKPGDTLLIIEAMKVMNPIKAAQAGTVSEILVTNGKPVEFGENLVILA